jgi:glycosyltransferase involved in cell wall biosynthesis
MLKPLYVSPIGKGGVDVGIQNITRSIRNAGHQPELKRLPHLYNFLPMAAPRAMGRNWWKGYDLVQARSRVAWALRRPELPLVTTVHHLTTDRVLQPYSSLAQRMFYWLVEYLYDGLSIHRADGVVCVSKYTQDQVARTYGVTNTTLVFDGIDTDVFTPSHDLRRTDVGLPGTTARVRILFVGNRTRRKGFDLLPAIMDRLPQDYVLYYTESFQVAAAAPAHPRMIAIGTPDRDGLVAAYQSCDMLLFPVRVEGFGIVAAEAGACGRPVVTTAETAVAEVVDDGVSGFLCPMNDVETFAARVRELGENVALRRQFGQAGRDKVVKTFGYEQLAAGLLSVYERVGAGHVSR